VDVEVRGYGVVGGEPTADWAAVVAYLFGGEDGGLCSGTLIGPRAVLTAAHCAVDGVPGDQIFVGPSLDEAGQLVDVAQAIPHVGYQPDSHRLDVAVLLLADEVDEIPVELNTESVDKDWIGTTMRVVGYGNEDGYAGTTAGIKRETDVEIGWVDGPLIYHETPGHNTCSGDSGGPLLVEEGDGWVQVAVTSFVYPLDPDDDACDGGGGENRVDTVLGWIAETAELDIDIPEPGDDDDDDVSDDDDDVSDDDDDASDDDDDQPGESFLDDEDPRGGCAASLTGRNVPPACGLLAALALGLWLGPRRRG
jgi:hypothetical protein